MAMPAAELQTLTEAVLADLDGDTLLYVVLDPGGAAVSRRVALTTLDQWLELTVGAGIVQTVAPGTNVSVDDTDPANPIVAVADALFVTASDGGREVVQTHGATGAAETIDIANGNVHVVTQDEACTYTFTNPADATAACSFTLLMTAVTGAATWPASVNWPDGTAPTLSGRCILTFITVDGGTTWDGFLAGSGLA